MLPGRYLTPDEIDALAVRIGARVLAGKTVHLTPASAMTCHRGLHRLLADVQEGGLEFRVDCWTPEGQHIYEALARTSSLSIGTAAYFAAVASHAKDRITLRHGCRLIRDSHATE